MTRRHAAAVTTAGARAGASSVAVSVAGLCVVALLFTTLLQTGTATAAMPATATTATSATTVAPMNMADRVLACTACHGDEGRAGPDAYYPRIAGKPAGYLYNQLLNFRDGRRRYALMTHLLDVLPDAFLWDMARHFASLDPPYLPPATVTGAAAVTAAQRERGRRLIFEGFPERGLPSCASCHGDSLMGAQPAIPGLLGLPRDYLNAQLGAWQAGARRADAPDCMAEIAKRLSPDEVAAATSWLAAQRVPAGARPAPSHGELPKPCGGLRPAVPSQ
jgi:cytochrome c553